MEHLQSECASLPSFIASLILRDSFELSCINILFYIRRFIGIYCEMPASSMQGQGQEGCVTREVAGCSLLRVHKKEKPIQFRRLDGLMQYIAFIISD